MPKGRAKTRTKKLRFSCIVERLSMIICGKNVARQIIGKNERAEREENGVKQERTRIKRNMA